MHDISSPSGVLRHLLLIKNSGRACALPEKRSNNRLLRYDLGGLRTLLAHGFLKLNGLAFVQGFKTLTLNFREMNEQILSIFGFNKTITFAFIKPLYFTY
jgi:hypothetical protein